MRYFFPASVLILITFLCLPSLSWPRHMVGEPELEKSSIWERCCQEQDCVPQRVEMIGNDNRGMILAKIEGVQASVAKEKFYPVPSPRSWVCYYDPNGKLIDDNIRCILYPQPSGTTRLFHRRSPGTKG